MRFGERTLRANILCVDAVLAIHPDQMAENVESAKDKVQDTTSEGELPDRVSHLLSVEGGLIQLSNKVAADEKACQTKPGWTVRVREEGPVSAVEVSDELDHGKLGEYEEGAEEGDENERGTFENEVCTMLRDMKDHSPAGHCSCRQADDSEDTDDLKNDHSNTPEGAELEESEQHDY